MMKKYRTMQPSPAGVSSPRMRNTRLPYEALVSDTLTASFITELRFAQVGSQSRHHDR